MKRLISVALSLVLILSLAGCGGGSASQPAPEPTAASETTPEPTLEPTDTPEPTSTPEPTAEPTPTPEPTEEPEPEPDDEPEAESAGDPVLSPSDSLSVFVSALETTLSQMFGDNYDVSVEGHAIVARYWHDGSLLTVMSAMLGDEDALNTWNKNIEDMLGIQRLLDDQLEELGLSEYYTIVQYLNEENTDNSLATVAHDEVYYDYVNGIDILADGD